MTTWDWIGWMLFAAFLWQLWPVWFGLIQLKRIDQFTPTGADDKGSPFVSIVVPARDEAAVLEPALRRMLALDYPNYEVIAIDDRSSDGTGEIMDRVAADEPSCRVIHVTELPPGWLGKNHANMLGAKAARGEYLLFTDADVLFDRPVLRHAIAAMGQRKLDHLVLLTEMIKGGFWESVLMCYFILMFTIATKFTLARYRWAKNAYVGVGAFNLVRRAVYDAFGGHERLRMEIADDVMVGRLVKQAGFVHEALLGMPLVRVKWQTGVRGIVRGLEKNAFAGTRYSIAFAIFAVLAQLVVIVAPPVLAVTGPARLPFAILGITTWLTLVASSWLSRYNPLVTLFYPVAAIIFCFTIARSMAITLKQGGVRWRDTFYPLKELRDGMATVQARTAARPIDR